MEVTLLVILLILVIVILSRFTAMKNAVTNQNETIDALQSELLAFQNEFRVGDVTSVRPEPPIILVAYRMLWEMNKSGV